jgi:hypothetical protein
MKITLILFLLSILINSSYANAGFSLDESAQCYASSDFYRASIIITYGIVKSNLEKMNKEDKDNFEKLDISKGAALVQIDKVASKLKEFGVNELIKSGKSISEANSIFEAKVNKFNNQFIYDKKISVTDYNQTLENIFNDCQSRFIKEFKKNH